MSTAIELRAVDTLFFRDARPMQAGAGSGGHGANWPLPTTLHEALRSLLLTHTGRLPSGKDMAGVRHRHAEAKTTKAAFGTRAFESLRVKGPFPIRGNKIYFPTPLDLTGDEKEAVGVMGPLCSPKGAANLPASWLRPVASRIRAGKNSLGAWVSRDFFVQYLTAAGEMPVPDCPQIYYSESRIGVAIDRSTGAAVDGKLYAAEHLRLDEGTGIWVEASLNGSENDGAGDNPLQTVMGERTTLGGEARMCQILPGAPGLLDGVAEPEGSRIKWVLTTPAVFRGGWLPNWVRSEDGAVMLSAGDNARRPGEDRLSWRSRVRRLPPVKGRLVAARLSSPRPFSGWDLQWGESASHPGGPKPTYIAVPAGSVFYFEANDPSEARHLVRALHGRTMSDFFGEKGMGLGFCGSWIPMD